MNRLPDKERVTSDVPHAGWGAALILLITVLVYLPVWQAGFIWDDDVYVTQNSFLTAPDGLKRIWFSQHKQSQYFPLVYTTLRFERMMWGLNPMGYHVVNVLLHSMNALLILAVLRRLKLPGAWLAAAIFAVHPVQVESVAWITELKNTQSTLFYLLALLAWMKFVEQSNRRRWRFYALALLLYALALFSKTTACTLPAAMMLVMWLRKNSLGRDKLTPLVSFVVFGVAMGLVSVWWERHLGNYRMEYGLSFGVLERLLIATRALWFYAGKLVWPAHLTFSYPRWEINTGDLRQYVWVLGWVALAWLLWWRRNVLRRGVIASVVFFVAALAPMLGFVPLYTFRFAFVADHYQYLACAGLIALFAAALANVRVAWGLSRTWGGTAACLLLFGLGALTWRQAGIYRNVETLWGDTLVKNPGSWMAHHNLGNALVQQDRVPEGIAHLEQALRLKPDLAEGHDSLGTALVRQGRASEGIAHYEQALRLKPGFADAHNNLGAALFPQGRVLEAVGCYEQALRLKPDFAEAHCNLGLACFQLGKVPEALGHLEQALRLKPDYADARGHLGNVLFQLGRVPEAVEQYAQVLRFRPADVVTRMNLGLALFRLGQVTDGIGQLAQVLHLKPDYAEARYNLGVALMQLGRVAEAIEQYEQTLRLKPEDAEAQSRLAWVLATCADGTVRDGPRAIELAGKANRIAGGKNPVILDTLAAAYAEGGRFGDAVRTAQAAIELGPAAGQPEQASQIQARLRLYQTGRPYHEGSAPGRE